MIVVHWSVLRHGLFSMFALIEGYVFCVFALFVVEETLLDFSGLSWGILVLRLDGLRLYTSHYRCIYLCR